MSNETIKVIYEPLGSILGVEYYHETLEYTNSSGQDFFADSGPTSTPGGSQLYDVSEAAGAASTSGSSVYGSLFCASGTASQVAAVVGQTGFNNQTAASNPSSVVDSGANLSQQWSAITSTCSAVNSAGLAYSPATQNSNSVGSTELTAAAIALPSTGITSGNWAPASDNILGTSLTKPADPIAVSVSTTNGVTTVSIADSNGTALNFTSNSGGTSDTGKLTVGGKTDGTETDTIASGSQTDILSGTSVTSGTSFQQTTNIASNGTTTASISGSGDEAGLTNATITVTGTATLDGSHDTINEPQPATGTVSAVTVDGGNNSVNITGTNRLDFPSLTLDGDDNTVTTTGVWLPRGGGGTGPSIDVAANTDGTVVDDKPGGAAVVNFGSDSSGIVEGTEGRVTVGTDDQVYLNTTSTVTASGDYDTLDIGEGEYSSIDASYDTVVGKGSDILDITGIENKVYDDSSTIDFIGNDGGDHVSGIGDSGSGWDGYTAEDGSYGGYAGGGYYDGGDALTRNLRRAVSQSPAGRRGSGIDELAASDGAGQRPPPSHIAAFHDTVRVAGAKVTSATSGAHSLVQAMTAWNVESGGLAASSLIRDSLLPVAPQVNWAHLASSHLQLPAH